MGDGLREIKFKTLVFQKRDRDSSYDDGCYAKSNAAPTFAPGPVSLARVRISKSLDDEKSGGRNCKQDLKHDQKKFADRDVDEPFVERGKRKNPTEDHIRAKQNTVSRRAVALLRSKSLASFEVWEHKEKVARETDWVMKKK